MTDLLVLAFDDESTAFDLRAELVKLQKDYLVEMEDVVVVTRSTDNKVQLHQVANLTAVGAVSGGFWGALLGMLFFNPLLGAAVGAGAGALTGSLSDTGIEDEFMRKLGADLKPGTAAVFVLLRKFTADKVIDRLGAFRSKARILQTSLTKEVEDSLRAVLEPSAT